MLEQARDPHRLQKMKLHKQNFLFRSEMLNLVEGNTDAAVLLSCCHQRQQMEKGNQDSDLFWMWGDLAGVIGLSRTRLDSSRHILRRSGILTERKNGWPAKLELHINLDLLEKQLAMSTPELAEDKGIPVNRELLSFTGKNIHAALMLSYAMRRQREANATLPPEKYGIYWPMRQQEWLRVFGLKRRKQESARNVLRETGCWKERQWGWPAENQFHLDFDRLLTILPAAGMLSDVKKGPA